MSIIIFIMYDRLRNKNSSSSIHKGNKIVTDLNMIFESRSKISHKICKT
jgi:hypothetical protein